MKFVHKIRIAIMFVFFFLPVTTNAFGIDSVTVRNNYVAPDPVWQSIAGAGVYSGLFFVFNGDYFLHHHDSLVHQQYGGVSTLAFSSFFSALTVSIVGNVTASRNGGSYLSTLTVDWIASTFLGAAVNSIYKGNNPVFRFFISMVPSVSVLVLMNQLFYDPNSNKATQKSTIDDYGSFLPMVSPSYLGISYQKQF